MLLVDVSLVRLLFVHRGGESLFVRFPIVLLATEHAPTAAIATTLTDADATAAPLPPVDDA